MVWADSMSDFILVVGQCYLFHCPVILPHISNSGITLWIGSISGLMVWADTVSDHILI